MSQTVSGTFIADGNALNVNIGFLPDFIEAFELTSDPEIVYRWYRCLADAGATGQHGLQDSGAGVLSACGNALAGFAEYEESDDFGVLVESPIPGTGLLKATVIPFVAGTTAPTERSNLVIGTITRPSTANGYVYECTTTAGVYGTEPTWGTTIGGTTSDGTNTWTCREENLAKLGGKGFTIGATLSENSDVWVFRAERHDRMGDFGDAAGVDPVTFG